MAWHSSFLFVVFSLFSSNLPNCLAISRPMPDEPPVTSTVCLEFFLEVDRERERTGEREHQVESKSKKGI